MHLRRLQPLPTEASFSDLPEGVKHLHSLAHLAHSESGTLGTTTCIVELMVTG